MKKIRRILIFPLVIMGVILMFTNSCKKDDDNVPVLETYAISDITQTTATCGGNITSDGGSTVTAKGVCWSTGQTPTVSNSKTTDGTEAGSFTSNLTGLTTSTTYYVRAYATNANGTGYGSAMSFTTQQGVTDIDGNVYHVVTIGTQVWMAENLKVTKYNNGTAIPLVTTDNTAWGNLTAPGYCWYNNDQASYGNTYGALYKWATVNTGNLCPTGWHVPTDAEWITLIDYLAANGHSGAEGTALKATSGWNSGGNGTDNYGFSALPSGFRNYGGYFEDVGDYGGWWSATDYSTFYAWGRLTGYNQSTVYRFYNFKTYGFSVRCVKD
ncbi:MAG: hypothetical protein KAT68_00445 [Bacteroidales bacterium]|nr:hypothetical protein [Bacteroidales bacterium]